MGDVVDMVGVADTAGTVTLYPEVHPVVEVPADLYAEWSELARRDRCGHFHHFPQWLATAIERRPEAAGAVRVVRFRDGAGRCRALIPVRRVGGAWQVPRNDQTSYIDLVADGEATARAALRGLPAALRAHGGGRILLDRVLEGGNALVPDSGARLELLPEKASDWLDLRDGSEAFLAGLSGHFRKELRRKHRRAGERGEVRLVVERAGDLSPEARAAALADFLRLEAGGWKGREGSGTAIALEPGLEAFYQAILDAMEDPEPGAPRWRIHRLFLAETCVAAQLAVEAGDTVYLLKIAFDEALAPASPGLLAVAELVRALDGEPGIRWLTFVTGNRYQAVWRPQRRAVYRVTLYTPGPAGWLARWVDAGRGRLRDWRRQRQDRRAGKPESRPD